MLVKMSDWEKIRHHFSEDEKAGLNKAIVGETICPHGIMVDEAKCKDAVIKIKNLLGGTSE